MQRGYISLTYEVLQEILGLEGLELETIANHPENRTVRLYVNKTGVLAKVLGRTLPPGTDVRPESGYVPHLLGLDRHNTEPETN